jgi:3(or 17)beta-hydroxysteroid dehydrogenase
VAGIDVRLSAVHLTRPLMKGSPKMKRLSQKIALVTGAAQGIGAAIAEAMVAEGATVILTDIHETLLNHTAQRLNMPCCVLDVRQESHWTTTIQRVLKEHGALHVLVNNAGITGLEHGAIHDPEHTSLDEWRRVHATNLDGVFLGCQHALRAMRNLPAGETGSIINMSSRSGIVGIPAAAAYASSNPDRRPVGSTAQLDDCFVAMSSRVCSSALSSVDVF